MRAASYRPFFTLIVVNRQHKRLLLQESFYSIEGDTLILSAMPAILLLSDNQDSTLRYLASRMMGDTWIAQKLARELSDLSPAEQLQRLRGFLAAATISNTVAAEICHQHGIVVGIPTVNSTISECIETEGRTQQPRNVSTHEDALNVSHLCTEQLLLTYRVDNGRL